MIWINDFKLLLCSWIYDLNFPVSRQIVQEKIICRACWDISPLTPE